jgi:hypothetical protein
MINLALAAEYMVLDYVTHKEIQKKHQFLNRTISSDDTPDRFKDALRLMH